MDGAGCAHTPETQAIAHANPAQNTAFSADIVWPKLNTLHSNVTPSARLVRAVVARLPPLTGRPVTLEVRAGLTDRRGVVHAGSFLRERRIAFEAELVDEPREFARIFVHELFHFVWLRLGNPRRWSYEALLRDELRRGALGELGWSAEWRKRNIRRGGRRHWREYACESFCDTAAWLFSGVRSHPEYTLASRFREGRRQWFAKSDVTKGISI